MIGIRRAHARRSLFNIGLRCVNVLVSKSFSLPTIRLREGAIKTQMKELGKRISLAPGFYKNAPVVIDAEDVSNSLSMETIKQVYQDLVVLDLQPVGITNLSSALQKEAQEHGIPIITVPKGQSRSLDTIDETKNNDKTMSKEASTVSARERKEILSTVRSGQQVYAKGPKAQLIILGNVSSGAEVLSDGDIHIHGALLGRALAGINGDEESRIYTKSMQAELVAIGGLYTSGDALPDPVEASTQPCMVFVADGKLSFALASPF